MIRTFKYKAKINKTTEVNAKKVIELCRQLYNLALEQRIMLWKQRKKSISCYDQIYQLPEFKKGFIEFKTIDAQCLQDVLERLDQAYKNFFRKVKQKEGRIRLPCFKSPKQYHSFTLKENSWILNKKYLTIRNVGTFKLFLSRPVQGIIKTVTIKKTLTGNWFVYFSCDNVPAKELPITNKEVGIDVGIKNFTHDSDNFVTKNPKFLIHSQKELRRKQRAFSRKKRGSNRRDKARIQVAKLHEKIKNQREDFIHKLSNHYIENYDSIYIEKLNKNGMQISKTFNRHLDDSTWNTFFDMLSNKAESANRTIVKVDPRGTSKICSKCGTIVEKSLSVRVHNCHSCGLKINRDLNAALNIKAVGQSVQASTVSLEAVA